MISNDFEYELQKTAPSSSTKKAPRQMKHKMRLHGANMSLIKLVHNEAASTSSQRDTLQPFVVYSLNKKDRWQISDKMSATVLENLQEPDRKVVVVERRFDGLCAPQTCSYFHSHENLLTMSKVRSIYQMDPEFSAKKLRGAGRKYVEIEESPDVSYNIFKTPSNYTKLYANKTLSTMGYYQKRNRNMKNLLETEIFDDDDENTESQEEVEETPSPKFYNLSDHFVEKPRRKKESKYYGFLIV